ncbi:MAG: rhomboid family intramembrane serine protease [Candidatus Diapherotrites archaeon]|nr:rhomboid family intramembrane serine protease [Candidatus Diapherotrites archaeon]
MVSFVLLAGNQLFIPVEVQKNFAFNFFFRPWNLLFFQFVHTGPAHLIANFLLVFFLGAVVEEAIQKKHVLGLFFGVGILSFSLFNFFENKILGVGASGGAIALATAALVLSPKKAIYSVMAVLVFSLTLLWVVNSFQFFFEQKLFEQKEAVKRDLAIAVLEKNQFEIQAKTQQLKPVSTAIEQKVENKKFEKETQVANAVHFFASVLAIFYLLVFCQGETRSALKNSGLQLKG